MKPAEVARRMGVAVVNLDMEIPFTAARARNEVFQRLRQLHPDLAYVQFVDVDCEIVDGWLDNAAAFLDQHTEFAVVCGRRRERFPDKTIYNMMRDLEWNTPVGETKACGGRDFTSMELTRYTFMPTLSMCFRNVIRELPESISRFLITTLFSFLYLGRMAGQVFCRYPSGAVS